MATNSKVFVSPGVYTSEVDLSFVAQSVGVTTLGIAGETLIGPAFEPIFIRNYDEFTTYFGGTSPEKFVNTQIPKYEAGYIAKAYLQQSNQLFVTRILGLSGYDAGPSWSIRTVANVDPTTIDLYCLSAVTSSATCDTTCVTFKEQDYIVTFTGCTSDITTVGFTSAFPANYGNALSGVFDIRLRTGNKLKRENSININLLGVDLNSEGNFSKKKNGSYLFNYRFTNTKLLRQIGVVKALNVATPKFQDITFKINIPMKNQTFSIWGIGGENTSDYSISTFLELKNWSNFFASGINYNRQLNKNSSLESIVSYSGYEYYFERNQKWQDQKESKFSNLAYRFLRISNIFYSKILNFF
jgi:hypothetical protein